jgi:hypothetical protein
MGTVLKYEIKKSRFMFLISAVIIVLLEAAWLIGYTGIIANGDSFSDYGVFNVIFELATILLIAAAVCFPIVGVVYGVILYWNDIQKKSGYMLLLTPTATWKWILCKVLMGLLITAAAVVIFAIIGVTDIFLVINQTDPDSFTGMIMTPIKHLFTDYALDWILLLLTLVFQLVCNITTIHLAMAMARTLLGSKKIGGFVAIIFWLALNLLQSACASVLALLPDMGDGLIGFDVEFTEQGLEFGMGHSILLLLLTLLLNVAFSAICYGVTVYLTDKKMSF